jgi:hypothetical protein
MMKLFFAVAVVTTLVIRINCQLVPTIDQLTCFSNAAVNNAGFAANCPSMQLMTDANLACTNSACMSVVVSLFNDCGFDFASGEFKLSM